MVQRDKYKLIKWSGYIRPFEDLLCEEKQVIIATIEFFAHLTTSICTPVEYAHYYIPCTALDNAHY
jgi:hypothetical protein